jgi:hypothetical protein
MMFVFMFTGVIKVFMTESCLGLSYYLVCKMNGKRGDWAEKEVIINCLAFFCMSLHAYL